MLTKHWKNFYKLNPRDFVSWCNYTMSSYVYSLSWNSLNTYVSIENQQIDAINLCLYHWILVILSVKSFPIQANDSNINEMFSGIGSYPLENLSKENRLDKLADAQGLNQEVNSKTSITKLRNCHNETRSCFIRYAKKKHKGRKLIRENKKLLLHYI